MMKQLLFSHKGRIDRRVWWQITLISMAIYSAVSFTTHLPALNSEPYAYVGSIIQFILFIPTVWVLTVVSIKRYHDIGKTGWHALWGIFSLVFFYVTIMIVLSFGREVGPAVLVLLPLAACLGLSSLLWLVICGCFKGK